MTREIADISIATVRQAEEPVAPKTWLLSWNALRALAILAPRTMAFAFAALVLVQLAMSPDAVSAVPSLAMAGLWLMAAFARRGSTATLLIGYMAVFVLFVNLRPVAGNTGMPVQYDYAVVLERLAFFGTLPSAWLQRHFYVPGRVTALEMVLAITYVSYFAAPHLAAILVWWLRPALFPRIVVAIALTFLLGLLIYFLVPTAPPWLASETGRTETVHRVMPELTAHVSKQSYSESSDAIGVNDVAAMPSLHMALTVIVGLVVARFGAVGKWLGRLYIAMMAVALVYLGEHYVVDELAGVLLALVVWKLVFNYERVIASLRRIRRPARSMAPISEA
jgi:membrane-associated phospholipid phosphatase